MNIAQSGNAPAFWEKSPFPTGNNWHFAIASEVT
jgi:hypothetical protein